MDSEPRPLHLISPSSTKSPPDDDTDRRVYKTITFCPRPDPAGGLDGVRWDVDDGVERWNVSIITEMVGRQGVGDVIVAEVAEELRGDFETAATEALTTWPKVVFPNPLNKHSVVAARILGPITQCFHIVSTDFAMRLEYVLRFVSTSHIRLHCLGASDVTQILSATSNAIGKLITQVSIDCSDLSSLSFVSDLIHFRKLVSPLKLLSISDCQIKLPVEMYEFVGQLYPFAADSTIEIRDEFGRMGKDGPRLCNAILHLQTMQHLEEEAPASRILFSVRILIVVD